MNNVLFSRKRLRSLLAFSLVLTVGFSMASCTIPAIEEPTSTAPSVSQPEESFSEQPSLSDGQYGVQQVTYDDSTGEYNVILLDTQPGDPSIFRTVNLPMARLTDEEIANNQKSYLRVEQGQPALHLTEDFRIEYIHNVTETTTNPQTGQTETVIVQQQTGFWAPFTGALAGQALGSLLFTPHYYMPPVYRPGVILSGYGSYGRTYDQAVSSYRTRYNAPPAEVRNRQTLRTTGRARSPNLGQTRTRRTPPAADRSTGTGYGSDNLRRDRTPSRDTYRRPSNFGTRSKPRSFGRRRR